MTAAPPLRGKPIQYELRIGVTGHRELDRPDDVKEAVRALLKQVVTVLERASADPLGPHGSPQSRIDRLDRCFTQCLAVGTRVVGPVLDVFTGVVTLPVRWLLRAPRWPLVPISPRRPGPEHQTPLKLTVISSLAKGADQIVARVVCELVGHPERRNRYLEAVLPFPPHIYEGDFTSSLDRDEFHSLLNLDRGQLNTHPEPTVLFPDFPDCPDPANPACPLPPEKAYAAAGQHVVDTSEIVVAVWDPAREEKPGGTGATVRYAVDRGRVVLWLDPSDLQAGPFLLRTRQPDEAVQPHAPERMHKEPLPSRAKQLSRNFHRLAGYNRDGAVNDKLLQRELHDRATKLAQIASDCGLPTPAAQTIIEALLPHVVRADHLGLRYRELRDFSARLWPTTAAVVVSLMAFQIIFLPAHYWLAWVELAVLLLGYVSYRVSLYDAWHQKWLNDRRLAEGLRGALFVALVRSEEDGAIERGRTLSVAGAFGRIQDPLPFYSPANAWFVATLKRVLSKEQRRFAASLNLDDGAQRRAVAAFLREAWILDQARYHQRNAETRRRVVDWTKRLRLAMIGALVLVAALHAFGAGHGGHDAGSPFARIDLWVAFATVALPAWAAAFHVMQSLDDHERLAERSALMASLLHGLADQLANVESLNYLRDCVSEAERILDLESAEWAESLIDRRPEFTG